MWYEQSVFYQIYPLGFCGAPPVNDGVPATRIDKVAKWIPHIQKLGADTVLFNPLFESDAHGYDTRDYAKVDTRLGTNEDFTRLCDELHKEKLRVVLDGVFNHAGRGFWAFQDVLKNRQNSPYKDWFYIDYNQNSGYNDGLWYDGWEGHFELVRLNLQNNDVVEYLLGCVRGWIEEFDIDGLRLDVAYTVDREFMRRLRGFVDGIKPYFFLMGEMLHGDYKTIVGPGMLDSATNYECYKGMYSSLNALNLFEIAYSLNRQFGPEEWTLYKGMHLFNFVDNHDVTRAATILTEKRHLPLLYGLLFGMPGIPCVYYGSEWGAEGDKRGGGDAALRASFEAPVENELFETIAKMAEIHKDTPALSKGGYRQVHLTNKQFIFERKSDEGRMLIALNAEDVPQVAHFNAEAGMAIDRLSGEKVDFGGGYEMPPFSVAFLEMEK